MPRGPRFILAGVPHHVISRGNNRQQIFFEDEDIARYLHFLHDALQRFDCDLHAYVVMPNHVHALFTVLREGPPRCEFESLENESVESGRSTLRPYSPTSPAAGSVGAIVRAFKAAVTRRGRVEAGHLGPVWQRNYYEHIIGNDQEYLRARDYIARNAESWEIDKENPQERC